MNRIFEMLIVSFSLTVLYIFSYYGVFHTCLTDDVEFNFGKKRMRNRRKKEKGFLRKFLFLDLRNEVVAWHYAMFWINLISFIISLFMLNVFLYCGNKIVRIIFIISIFTAFLTSAIIAFVRWPLYAGNKVRNRKKYRKNKK